MSEGLRVTPPRRSRWDGVQEGRACGVAAMRLGPAHLRRHGVLEMTRIPSLRATNSARRPCTLTGRSMWPDRPASRFSVRTLISRELPRPRPAADHVASRKELSRRSTAGRLRCLVRRLGLVLYRSHLTCEVVRTSGGPFSCILDRFRQSAPQWSVPPAGPDRRRRMSTRPGKG
jgi:hypothetical protein